MKELGIKIGLETHVQLKSRSKLFCACAIPLASDSPNSKTCPTCLGYPGSKPVMNASVLSSALKLGTALGCTIAPQLVFSRKTYFYPDMSKNYQITQFEEPLCTGGSIKIRSGKRISLTRIHIEEDPAALVHPEGIRKSRHVLIDYNRSGNPLCEIVTDPVLETPAEAREYLKELVKILEYLGVYDEGSCILKADANISIRGHPRVEVKNISSFKEVELALNYELVRQQAVLARGNSGLQETRGWDETERITYSLRTKESEDDYGYVYDCDLVPRIITKSMILEAHASVPELAHVKEERYIKDFGLDPADAEILASSRALAELFEAAAPECDPVTLARWLRRELLRVLNYAQIKIEDSPISKDQLTRLLRMLSSENISDATGRKLMEVMMTERVDPEQYVKEHGLEQVRSTSALTDIARRVLGAHSKAVSDYRSGSEKALHFLMGQVMRETKGTASPEAAKQALLEHLKE